MPYVCICVGDDARNRQGKILKVNDMENSCTKVIVIVHGHKLAYRSVVWLYYVLYHMQAVDISHAQKITSSKEELEKKVEEIKDQRQQVRQLVTT